MFCDFVVIKINDICLDKCNVIFRRDDGKDINVYLYNDNLGNVGIVYKFGVIMGVIQGYIYSVEFYNKYVGEGNWQGIFFVKGIDGMFFEEGDSGLLVFFRLRSI